MEEEDDVGGGRRELEGGARRVRQRLATPEGMGLEALHGLVLETILSKLDARDAVAVACVSTRLRAAASDDAVWRRLLASDFDVADPVDPEGNTCASYMEAYRTWVGSFGMYPLPLVRRVKRCWTSLRCWLAANFPEANNTLKKGASESKLKWIEDTLEVKLPVPTKVLYRFCDGQETLPPYPSEYKHLAALGIIGGYEFFDHHVNVHLLPLNLVALTTKYFARLISPKPNIIILAASFYMKKIFFLNCADAQLYVSTRYWIEYGDVIPCVPQELINPTVCSSHDMPQDAFLLWLEEHSRRLHSGMIRTRVVRNNRSISLYPEAPPSCSVTITNGIKVRASAVFVPEDSDISEEEDAYLYAYSIRMSLLSDGCHSSCQLYSEHWTSHYKENEVDVMSGDAVIGKNPLLISGEEELVYERYTLLPEALGSVEGYLTFVPGSLSKPEGGQLSVKVAPLNLEKPKYIF